MAFLVTILMVVSIGGHTKDLTTVNFMFNQLLDLLLVETVCRSLYLGPIKSSLCHSCSKFRASELLAESNHCPWIRSGIICLLCNLPRFNLLCLQHSECIPLFNVNSSMEDNGIHLLAMSIANAIARCERP